MIIIEGAQGVGKTFLLSAVKQYPVYKFPYTKYFRDFLKRFPDDTGHGSREAHHHTTGYDITLLSLNQHKLLSNNIIIDRGFISNIVFSIIEGRSTLEEGLQYIDWLDHEGYLKNLHIVWLRRAPGVIVPDRNKDEWEFLHKEQGYKEQDDLYSTLIDYTAHRKNGPIIHEINNKFNEMDIMNFINVMNEINEGWLTLGLDSILEAGLYEIKLYNNPNAIFSYFDKKNNFFTNGGEIWNLSDVSQYKKQQ